jgi:hypothetical protein
MDDEAKPAEDEPQVSPAITELLKARATGQTPPGPIPLPPDMIRRREEIAEFLKQRNAATPAEGQAADTSAAGQDPARRIGPQNPDHPDVNRNPGGRDRS